MLQHIKNEENYAYTENGGLSRGTTCCDCLDLFASIGALRSADSSEIISRFQLAFAEAPDLAMKVLFFARDIRGGLGQRRVFRVVMHALADAQPQAVRKNLPYFPEYGRWDDLLALMGTACETDALELIRHQLTTDMLDIELGHRVSLLAKWLPSVNASSPDTVRMAKHIARFLEISDAEYRKMLVELRQQIRIIENNLRQGDYSFDYSKQPSKALFKYRQAFLRNDGPRYNEFLCSVSRGKAWLNTGTLTPYDIIAPLFEGEVSPDAQRVMDVTWNSLPDFAGRENALVVIDGSGSMYANTQPRPAAVALSLGIYFAQRNTGAFRDHFITFSQNPRLVKIKGTDIVQKVRYCQSFNEVANTDIQKVFELILRAAVKNGVPQSQMPSTLYIISDMEFDSCTAGAELTNFQYAQRIFAQAGYRLPRVVFWNVASRTRHQPVTMNEQGVALVSGCSPRIFDMLSAGDLSPMGYMLDILHSSRYRKICA